MPEQPVQEPRGGAGASGIRPRRGHWLRWLVGLGMLGAVALGASHVSEQRDLLRFAGRASPRWLLLGLVLQAGTYVAQAAVWRTVLARSGSATGWLPLLRLTLAKLFLDETVPSGGVSGTLLLVQGLRRRGKRPPALMAGVIVNVISYWASFVLLVLMAVWLARLQGPARWAVLAGAAATCAVGGLLISLLVGLARGHRSGVFRLFVRLKPSRALARALACADRGLARSPRLLATATLQQMAIQLLDAATLWVMLMALGLRPSLAAVFASFMISMVVRTAGSMIPAGLGAFEAASVGMLAVTGVSTEAALAATLLFRGLSLWLPLVPGLLLCRPELRLRGSPGALALEPLGEGSR